MRTVKFGWETIHTAIDTLAYYLEPWKLVGIVGISRGGLIPAAMLSHKMGIPMETIVASSYADTDHSHSQVKLLIEEDLRKRILSNPVRWVVIDDILDSGNTYDVVKQALQPHIPYAVVVTKRPVLRVPAFANVPHDVWVKFPWE